MRYALKLHFRSSFFMIKTFETEERIPLAFGSSLPFVPLLRTVKRKFLPFSKSQFYYLNKAVETKFFFKHKLGGRIILSETFHHL